MRLTISILGLEILDVELTADTEGDGKARDLSGGALSSERLDVPTETDRFMGFTNGRECDG